MDSSGRGTSLRVCLVRAPANDCPYPQRCRRRWDRAHRATGKPAGIPRSHTLPPDSPTDDSPPPQRPPPPPPAPGGGAPGGGGGPGADPGDAIEIVAYDV